MSNLIDIPKELRRMLGEGEEVVYKGKTKRYAPGGEPLHPTEIFVTNQRIILYNHKFFGRGTIEDLHFGDILNTIVKKGMLSADIELKSRFPGNDTIVIQAVSKQKVYEINALITTGIKQAAYVIGGRFPQ
jgi:PH (Pleckstrin Homology) domain-containing protein